MAVRTLTKRAVSQIEKAVDRMFDRIKGRALGPDFVAYTGDKKIFVGFNPQYSLPGIYRRASIEESAAPNERVLHGLVKVAGGYIDAERERVKAQVINAVNAWLLKDPDADPEVVLGGELAPIFKQTLDNVAKILDTESTKARNMGTLEGVTKVSAARDIEDPNVFFIVVRDKDLCAECKRVHLLPDEKTPRVFKLSEVSGGYHQRGTDTPSVGGLHPHCRCTISDLSPGYGFDKKTGLIKFIGIGHDEFANQRG